MKQHRPPFQHCGTYDVWAQWDVETTVPYGWFLPQHFALGFLVQAYPNATWILNTRSTPTIWADSILHWYSMTRRIFHAFHVPYYPQQQQQSSSSSSSSSITTTRKVTVDELDHDMQHSLEQRIFNTTERKRHGDLLEQIYRKHIHRIQTFVQSFPSIRLIQINVDDTQQTLDVLNATFFPYSSSSSSTSYSSTSYSPCSFVFSSTTYDDDWNDFSLKV